MADKTTTQVIDQLDRLGLDERPSDMKASTRPNELIVSSGDQKYSLAIPDDKFYLSMAPYVVHTHECFFHSLTTCKGKSVHVRIFDSTGKVLVEADRTTFANRFIGFWLPKNINGTLRISYGGKSAESPFSTGANAPTCLTTLKLV